MWRPRRAVRMHLLFFCATLHIEKLFLGCLVQFLEVDQTALCFRQSNQQLVLTFRCFLSCLQTFSGFRGDHSFFQLPLLNLEQQDLKCWPALSFPCFCLHNQCQYGSYPDNS
jgi:hypothetical protein